MQNRGRLIIVVSDERKKEYDVLKKKMNGDIPSCLYTDGKIIKASRKNFDYDFAFVSQNDDIEEIIKNIIKEQKEKKICIAVHNTGHPISKVNTAIGASENKKNIIHIKEFSHEPSHDLWKNGLKPFIECIAKDFNHYEKLYEDIWKIFSFKDALFIPALSILSQGYLALHGKLDEININELMSEESIKEKAPQTEDPKWWQEALGESKTELLGKIEEEWTELPLPDDITALVEIIYSCETLSEQCEIVSSAYQQISERLKA